MCAESASKRHDDLLAFCLEAFRHQSRASVDLWPARIPIANNDTATEEKDIIVDNGTGDDEDGSSDRHADQSATALSSEYRSDDQSVYFKAFTADQIRFYGSIGSISDDLTIISEANESCWPDVSADSLQQMENKVRRRLSPKRNVTDQRPKATNTYNTGADSMQILEVNSEMDIQIVDDECESISSLMLRGKVDEVRTANEKNAFIKPLPLGNAENVTQIDGGTSTKEFQTDQGEQTRTLQMLTAVLNTCSVKMS